MKLARVPLQQVCEVNPTTRLDLSSSDTCSFVPMDAIDEWTARIERTVVRPYKDLTKGFTGFAEGDVLLAKITPCMENGKCAIARRLRNKVGFGSTEFHVLRAREAVLPEWLFYFWRLPATRTIAEQNMTGSAGQKRVPTVFLEDLEIPLPGIAEQRRIVAQLEQADRLRRSRRYSLELSDSFLPATFRRMFGDPVRNSMGWSCMELGDIAAVDRGKFTPRPRNDPSYFGGEFPFIQTGDISKSGGRLCTWTQTLNERGIAVSRSFPVGSVVIAIVGATIGMTAILEKEVFCPDSVIGIQVDPSFSNSEYIEMLLRFWRPVFIAQAPETARANINLDTLRPLKIPLPPLHLQKHFATLVSQHEHLRATQRESLRQAEHLFQTLLHRAFSVD